VGDECEARVTAHTLTLEVPAEGEATLRLAIAATPGAAVTLAVGWGDATADETHSLSHGDRVALRHGYAAPGSYPVTARACANLGGCNTDTLGMVQVASAPGETAPIQLGLGALDPQLSLVRGLAYGELSARAPSLGIVDAFDLELRRGFIDLDEAEDPSTRAPPSAHVHVQQTHLGVPVFGGEAIVHLREDGTVEGITDSVLRDVDINVVPSIDAAQAAERAATQLGCQECLAAASPAALGILRQADDHLVWRVRIPRMDDDAPASMPVYFIDALTGEVRGSYDDLQSAVPFTYESATAATLYNGTQSLMVSKASGLYWLEDLAGRTMTLNMALGTTSGYSMVTDDNAWTQDHHKTGFSAQWALNKTLAYFNFRHLFYGMDGAGGILDGTSVMDSNRRLITARVRYGSNVNNAFWDGSRMYFGNGTAGSYRPFVSLDIVGHEFTHGLVQKTAGLTYAGESGALNESYADVFGNMVELYAEGAESAGTWLVGEDVVPTNWPAIRSMVSPRDNSHPDHFSDYVVDGDVHVNSGIPNKAFHLLAKGGTHRKGGSMTGIGTMAAAKIWFKALRSYMTSSTDLAGARAAMLSAAASLHGANSTNYKAVADAWSLVGVGANATPAATPAQESPWLRNPGFEEGWTTAWTASRWPTEVAIHPSAREGQRVLSICKVGTTEYDPCQIDVWQEMDIPTELASKSFSFWLWVKSADSKTVAKDLLSVYLKDLTTGQETILETISNTAQTASPAWVRHVYPGCLVGHLGHKVQFGFRAHPAAGTGAGSATVFFIDEVANNGSQGLAGNGATDCDGSSANGAETHTMWDAMNCGGCGIVCPPPQGGSPSCVGGTCVTGCPIGACPTTPIDGQSTKPGNIHAFDGKVYWIEERAGGCVREFSDGDTRDVACCTAPDTGFSLAVNTGYVAFVCQEGTQNDKLMMAARAPDSTPVLVTTGNLSSSTGVGGQVAFAGQDLFYASQQAVNNRNIRRVSDERAFANDLSGLVTLRAGSSYITAFAVGAKVFWTENTGRQAVWAPLDFSESSQPADHVLLPEGSYVAWADQSRVFFGTRNGDNGMLVGGTEAAPAETSVADLDPDTTGRAYVHDMAGDATHLYFVTRGANDHVLARVAYGTSTVRIVLRGLGKPGGVAVDDAFVYWTELETNLVRRMRKPAP
jgi:Zn-dependent metalloprotease